MTETMRAGAVMIKVERYRISDAGLRERLSCLKDHVNLEGQRRIRGVQLASATGGGEISSYPDSPGNLVEDASFDFSERASVHDSGPAIGTPIQSDGRSIRTVQQSHVEELYGNVGFRLMEGNVQELLRAPATDEASLAIDIDQVASASIKV